EREPERRRHVLMLAEALRSRLRGLGLNIGAGSRHIVPVIVGEAEMAAELSKALLKRRLLVPAILPPAVPEGASRLRIPLTAGHTEEDVERLAQALKETIQP